MPDIFTARANWFSIKGVGDFPAPVGDVITLADDATYEISGNVDIGANRIVCGTRNIIKGVDRTNDKLTSSTTGALITCDSTSVVKTIVTLEGLTLSAASGSLFAATGTAANTQNLVIISCTIGAFTSLGTLASLTAVAVRNTTIFGPISSNGFTITGTGVGTGTFIFFRDCSLRGCAGTMFNFGTSVWAQIIFGRNIVTTAVGETFLSGATGGANVTVAGKLADNIFTGGGTYVSTLTNADINWIWHDNVGVTNTGLIIENRTSDPASPAVGQIWLRTDLI